MRCCLTPLFPYSFLRQPRRLKITDRKKGFPVFKKGKFRRPSNTPEEWKERNAAHASPTPHHTSLEGGVLVSSPKHLSALVQSFAPSPS